MNILLINGINHKGSTYHICKMLADKIANSTDNINEVFLPRDMNSFCTGCATCFLKDEKLCPHYSQTAPITKLMDNADIIIFTSPVYVYHATGSMKAFLDHYGYRWMVHRPQEKMFSKQAVIISTAAGGGTKTTNKDIADSCFYWGIPKIYKYGKAVYAVNWNEVSQKRKATIDKDMTRLASKLKNRSKKPTVKLKTKLLFQEMKFLQKKVLDNPPDKAYWQSKGWFDGKHPW